ncbi:MAG: hypothetical protein MUC38_08135 [Cyclobacteriaceae bacterium]|jgi:hypothetical protein|nr:hypothetical protein [Cyclobacteriaceae bacterium]
MNQRRIIFLCLFGAYHLSVILFILYVESLKANDKLVDLYDLSEKTALFKWGAIMGFGLFLVEAGWTWLDTRRARKGHESLRLENNTLKATVYDLQQAEKKRAAEATVQPKS